MQVERSGQSTAGIYSLALSLTPILLSSLSIISFPGQAGWMLGIFIFLYGIIFEFGAFILGLLGILQTTKLRVTAFLGTAISTAYSICLLYLVLY